MKKRILLASQIIASMLLFANRSRKNVMNVLGSYYSMVVVNQPKEISTINTKQTKYLRSVQQESITGGKINGYFYIYCSASTDHRFGCLRTVLVCTIQVHPSVRLLADWIYSGLGGGDEWLGWRRGTSILHMIPHRAELSRDSLYASFLSTAHWAQLYT